MIHGPASRAQVAPIGADLGADLVGRPDPLDTLDEIARFARSAAELVGEALHSAVHDLPPSLQSEVAPMLTAGRARICRLRDDLQHQADLYREILLLLEGAE